MKDKLQSGTSDKQNWKQYVFMSEKQKQKLIEEKLNRAAKHFALASKKK